MAISWGTAVFASNTSQTANAVDVTLTLAAGDAVYLAAMCSADDTFSCACITSPGAAPSVVKIGTDVTDIAGSEKYTHFYALITVSGSYTFRWSTGAPVGNTWPDLAAIPITGGATASILVANGPGQYQPTPSTATDALTSGTAQTPTGYPALVIGFSCDSFCSMTPAPGTGFSDLGAGLGFFGFGAGGRLMAKVITTGTAQVLATATGSGAHVTTMMAAFVEASAGGGVTQLDNLPPKQLPPSAPRRAINQPWSLSALSAPFVPASLPLTAPPARSSARPGRIAPPVQNAPLRPLQSTPTSSTLDWINSRPAMSRDAVPRLRIYSAPDTAPPVVLETYADFGTPPQQGHQPVINRPAQQLWALAAIAATAAPAALPNQLPQRGQAPAVTRPVTSLPPRAIGYDLRAPLSNEPPRRGTTPAVQGGPTALPPNAIGHNLPRAIENAPALQGHPLAVNRPVNETPGAPLVVSALRTPLENDPPRMGQPLRPTSGPTSLPPRALGYNLPPAIENLPAQRGRIERVEAPVNQEIPPPLGIVVLLPFFDAPPPFERPTARNALPVTSLPPRAIGYNLPAALPNLPPERARFVSTSSPVNPHPFAPLVVATLQPFFDAPPPLQAHVASTKRPVDSQVFNELAIAPQLSAFTDFASAPVRGHVDALRPAPQQEALAPLRSTWLPTSSPLARAPLSPVAPQAQAWALAPLAVTPPSEWAEFAAPPVRGFIAPTLRPLPEPWVFPGAGTPIVPDFIPSGEIVYVPTFLLPIVPGFIPSGEVVPPPSFIYGMQPSFITSGEVVFEPAFMRRPEQLREMLTGDSFFLVEGGNQRLTLARLPDKDGRHHALERLAQFIRLVTFRRTAGTGEPEAKPFRLKGEQVTVGRPDDKGGEADLPAIAILPGTGTHDSLGLGIPELIDETFGLYGDGTAVVKIGEYIETITLEVVAAKRAERRAIVAGLEVIFRMVADQGSLLLKLPEYFGAVADFNLETSSYVEDNYASQNRRVARLSVTLSMPELWIASGISRLRPTADLEVGDAVVFQLRADVDEVE